MTTTTKSMTNLSIKKDYKKQLERAARDLSVEFDERIPITHVVYELIDNHLEEAMASIRNKMNFD